MSITFNTGDFDVNQLDKYVKILTDNYKLKINDIGVNPQVDQSYQIVNEIIHSKDSQIPDKDTLIKLISRQYRPSQIIPETVGSFLFGCFQQTYGDIPAECSPLCAYSLSNENSLTLERCDSQIHIQYLDAVSTDNEIRFTKLGYSNSKQGYIFVNLDFLGFTHKEKEYLLTNGLLKIQVLVTKDSKHHTVLKMRDTNDIPIIEHIGSKVYVTSDQDSTESNRGTETDENAYIYIIFAIIIVAAMAMIASR